MHPYFKIEKKNPNLTSNLIRNKFSPSNSKWIQIYPLISFLLSYLYLRKFNTSRLNSNPSLLKFPSRSGLYQEYSGCMPF